jgi:large subunit ribosomal protein L3
MTRVFREDGSSVPVTVVEVTRNRVAQVKTVEKDGYSAIQVAFGEKPQRLLSKPEQGHLAVSESGSAVGLREIRIDAAAAPALGEELSVEQFGAGDKVDVTAVSKGKGYAGVIKRWNFRMQDATHGNSLSHRAPGSIGQNQSPGRVFKGKKMAGRLGGEQVTIQALEVIRIDSARNVLLIKGAVPGAPGAQVFVAPSVKSRG